MGTGSPILHVYRCFNRALKLLVCKRGITLVETGISATIATMLVGSMVLVSSYVHIAKKANEAQLLVTNEARIALEKMILGYLPAGDPNGSRDGIREAVDFNIANEGKTLQFTDDAGLQRSIRQTNNTIEYSEPGGVMNLLYDPETGVGSDEFTDLTFEESPNSVNALLIHLVLGRQILGRWYMASFTTEVALRNAN